MCVRGEGGGGVLIYKMEIGASIVFPPGKETEAARKQEGWKERRKEKVGKDVKGMRVGERKEQSGT